MAGKSWDVARERDFRARGFSCVGASPARFRAGAARRELVFAPRAAAALSAVLAFEERAKLGRRSRGPGGGPGGG
eukprot:4394850-Prymnesium_polylepis.1